jgi:predicted exporter
MEDALAEPELLALAELLPRDPLLLLPDALRTLSRQDGGRGNSSLVMAMLAVPPTDNTAQREVLGTLELLRTELRTAGVELAYTGAVRFSAENERVIRRDVLRINLLIGAVMLGLLLLVLRSLRALLLVVRAAGLPVRLVAVALCFRSRGSLHVLALGIAGILGGLALDYPCHPDAPPSR